MADRTKTKLTVKMFGGFSVSYGEEPLSLGRQTNSKFSQLFQLLLTRPGRQFSKREIMRCLYGQEAVEDANATLNNTVFRLRRCLEASPLPPGEYLTVRDGMIRFEERVPVDSDVCRFERLARAFERETDREKKTKLAQEALAFTSDAGKVADHITALEPLNENTDYGLGLQEALKLAQGNTGRETVVVFLSDGAPTANGSGDQYGTAAAAAIKALNVPIYGVLHSPVSTQRDAALKNMQTVCGAGNVYESTDTESFGKAMNDAFTAVYPSNTVTIPVSADFTNVRDLVTLNASSGEATYDPGTHTITWTIEGMPFTTHSLTYKMTLTPENTLLTGENVSFSVNNGVVTFGTEHVATLDLNTVRLARGQFAVTYMDSVTNTVYQTALVLAGKAIPAYTGIAPTREGYTFGGWARTDGVAYDPNGLVNSEITLTAVWNAIPTVPVVPDTPTTPTTPSTPSVDDDDDDDTIFVPDEPTPLAPAPAGPVAPVTPVAPVDPVTPPTVIVEDPQVPLNEAPTPEPEVVDVEEPEVPMASMAGWSLANLLLMIATLLGCAIQMLKKNDSRYRLLALVPAVGALLMFFLNENLRAPMVLFNNITVFMVMIAVVQVALVVLNTKDANEDTHTA